MHVALEVRAPLLDYTVIEAMMRIPGKLKSDKHNTKKVLKKVLGLRLPEPIWNRPKQGFGAPIDKWLRGPLNTLLHEYLHPERLKDEEIFDLTYISHIIKQHESEERDNQHLLWTLLMWEMWREYDQNQK
jgi:asparagine synthase (glutamine-hydrolysing)